MLILYDCGKEAVITAETVLQLEQALTIPASFWLQREQQYREVLARLAEEQRLASQVEWEIEEQGFDNDK